MPDSEVTVRRYIPLPGQTYSIDRTRTSRILFRVYAILYLNGQPERIITRALGKDVKTVKYLTYIQWHKYNPCPISQINGKRLI